MSNRSVLVVERDAALRETLRTLLHAAGFSSVGVSDLGLALEVLQRSPQPLVVLLEHGDPRFPAEALVQAASALSGSVGQPGQPGEARPLGHAYVLLSTYAASAPRLRNPYTRHEVPVLELPGDLERLLDTVEEAARRLHSAPQSSASPAYAG